MLYLKFLKHLAVTAVLKVLAFVAALALMFGGIWLLMTYTWQTLSAVAVIVMLALAWAWISEEWKTFLLMEKSRNFYNKDAS